MSACTSIPCPCTKNSVLQAKRVSCDSLFPQQRLSGPRSARQQRHNFCLSETPPLFSLIPSSVCGTPGEFLCLIPFAVTVWVDKRAAAKSGQLRGFHAESNDHKLRTLLSFLLPTLCDACATTLLNVGLFYTCAPRPSAARMARDTVLTRGPRLLTSLTAPCADSYTL